MRAIIYGDGYWSRIVQKYIVQNGITIVGIVDIDSSQEDENLYLQRSDVAFVCTPVNTHYELVKKLLLEGKHVFCEKVLTHTKLETEDLLKIAKEEKLILFTDYTFLYSPSVNYIRENISCVGNIKKIKGEMKQFGKFYEDCNVIETIGVHILSIIHYILQEDEICENRIEINNPIAYDYQYLGSIGGKYNLILDFSLYSNFKTRKLEIIGDKGILSYDVSSNHTVLYTDFENKDDNESINFDEKNNLLFTIRAFIKSVDESNYDGENQRITECVSNDLDII